ncbi:MAG: hypothetical protein Q7S09_04615 [bacterium]|nr:hypothetical protein [bacterium]
MSGAPSALFRCRCALAKKGGSVLQCPFGRTNSKGLPYAPQKVFYKFFRRRHSMIRAVFGLITMVLLAAFLFIWGMYGFVAPLLTHSVTYEDGAVSEIRAPGPFLHGRISTVRYQRTQYTEEASLFLMPLPFSDPGSISVLAEFEPDGSSQIKRVIIGDHAYTEQTLHNHPDVLEKATRVLKLGRVKYAEITLTPER